METVTFLKLRAVAQRLLSRERVNHTLQPTALVNEAWVKVSSGTDATPERLRHAMPHVLVESARRRQAKKRRPPSFARPTPPEELLATDEEIVLELRDALEALGRAYARPAEVFKRRFVDGESDQEIATALAQTTRRIRTDYGFACAWLAKEIQGR